MQSLIPSTLMRAGLSDVQSDVGTLSSSNRTPQLYEFFAIRRAFLRARLTTEASLAPFRQLPDALLNFLYAEKMSLALLSGTRFVKDDKGMILTGYSQEFNCQEDLYHPKEFIPFNLKGYWIPENEGECFIADTEASCPLIRKGSQGKEILFLIHPKSEHLFGPLMEKYKKEQVLISALSLSSFRTLLISIPTPDSLQQYTYTMVKLSLDEEIAGALRILSLKECASSVGMTALLGHYSCGISFFKDDIAFVPNAQLFNQKCESVMLTGAGMIHRQIPTCLLNSNHEYIIPFFSLFGSQNSQLLDLLIKQSKKSPTDFVKDCLLAKFAKILVDLIYNKQTSIEAHAQNLLLIIQTSDPDHLNIHFLYRDMGGVNSLLSEKEIFLLPNNLRNPDYYYLNNHFKDTARALEYFVTTILFNLTKQFFKSNTYEQVDPAFALWKSTMIEKGFSGNWTSLNEDPDAHHENFTLENFYRYGYFEKIFGVLLLETLLQQGIFRKLVGDQEVDAYHYFAKKLCHAHNPYNTCIEIEWFKDLILQTYPEYVELKINKIHVDVPDQVDEKPTVETMRTFIDHVMRVSQASPRPFYTPSADLFEVPIEKISIWFNSSYLFDQIRDNTFLLAMQEQIQNNLKHLRLEFEITHPEYVHDPVFSGCYPFQPTLNALKSAHNFLLAIEEKQSSEIFIYENLAIEAKIKALKKEHTAFIKEMIANPLKSYTQFKYRIESQGMNAKFEEFASLIEFLELSIQQEAISQAANQQPAFAIMRQMALAELERMRHVGYPYREMLDVLEYCLGFLDVFERGKCRGDKAAKLFHSTRYQYYSGYLKDELPKHLLIPTFYNLGASDILKVRGVPLGFIGVNAESVWVDGYSQTPLEFWYHDINHTRRMWQFFKKKAAQQGLSIHAFTQKSQRYVTEHLIPLISIEKDDDYKIANQKRMMKIILFEILHEDAFPADPEVIANALMAPPGSLTPVESIEGNKVQYIMEKSAAKLAIVHWKLADNFYDTIEKRNDSIVDQEYRSREFVIEAAMLMAEKLQLREISQSTIWEYLQYS